MPKIAIHQSRSRQTHSGSWSHVWVAECERLGLPYEVIDCFAAGASDQLRKFDILLFHFGNYTRVDMEFARHILASAKLMGLKVFPDYGDAWHFDDKVAQAYALDALGAPTPGWSVFYSLVDFQEWVASRSSWPVVAKLRTGSGSHNVKLLHSPNEALRYGRSMFGKGKDAAPSLVYKTASNVRSSRSLGQLVARARRAPEFIRTLARAKQFDRQRGYVYVQEFVPNDGFDIKIAVVEGKVGYCLRRVRSGDFRASGGADVFYDHALVPADVVVAARETTAALGARCIGFDFVVDKVSGQGRIIEMSFGFSHQVIVDSGGYWRADGTWDSSPLNAPSEILKGLIRECQQVSIGERD